MRKVHRGSLGRIQIRLHGGAKQRGVRMGGVGVGGGWGGGLKGSSNTLHSPA